MLDQRGRKENEVMNSHLHILHEGLMAACFTFLAVTMLRVDAGRRYGTAAIFPSLVYCRLAVTDWLGFCKTTYFTHPDSNDFVTAHSQRGRWRDNDFVLFVYTVIKIFCQSLNSHWLKICKPTAHGRFYCRQ